MINNAPKINLVTEASLSIELAAQAKELSHECFPFAFGEDAQEHEDKFCSSKDRFLFILAIEGANLVGKVSLFKRHLILDRRPLTLGGIGGLCVTHTKRQQRIATLMLVRAMAELKLTDCHVVFLCTDTGKPWMVKFYGSVGFKLLPTPYTYLGKSGRRYAEHDGMIAPVNSRGEFESLLSSQVPLDIGVGNW